MLGKLAVRNVSWGRSQKETDAKQLSEDEWILKLVCVHIRIAIWIESMGFRVRPGFNVTTN